MEFRFTPELEQYIRAKGKAALAVTVAATENSDINVEELHLRLLSRKDADFMKAKQHYRGFSTPVCEVLLPNYRLEYDDVVTFYLKHFLFIPYVKSEGIRF